MSAKFQLRKWSSLKHVFSCCVFVIAFLCFVGIYRAEAALPINTWNVNGTPRQALLYVPISAKTQLTPIVFAFHGHGGSMERVARMWDYRNLWPEAIVVYMQGLKTLGKLTDPQGNETGWQQVKGDQNNRDLKFFDTVLGSLKDKYQVDENRIYATGHSNGGVFTYILWEARPNFFAVFAPSAAISRPLVANNNSGFIPKPVLAIAGQMDTLVKFAWQQKMINLLIKANRCGMGKPWSIDGRLTLYPSAKAPVVTYIHSGGHVVSQDAPALVVKFFQQHVKS